MPGPAADEGPTEAPQAPQIPPAALAGLEACTATLVWALRPGVATWRLDGPAGEVRFLKVARAGAADLAAEGLRLAWAHRHLPVPAVLGGGADDEQGWLLTAGLPGAAASADGPRRDPGRLVAVLAQGLRRFHAAPAADCPFAAGTEALVAAAMERLRAGRVSPAGLHPEHADLTPTQMAERLVRLRPAADDAVVCHGDYCLPNVLIEGCRVSGYVDTGGLGVGDRWWDLAVATWSITWNLGPGWEGPFLAAYGLPPEPARTAFFRLLYDLLP